MTGPNPEIWQAIKEATDAIELLGDELQAASRLIDKLRDQQIGDLGFNKRQRDVIMRHVKKLEQGDFDDR